MRCFSFTLGLHVNYIEWGEVCPPAPRDSVMILRDNVNVMLLFIVVLFLMAHFFCFFLHLGKFESISKSYLGLVDLHQSTKLE